MSTDKKKKFNDWFFDCPVGWESVPQFTTENRRVYVFVIDEDDEDSESKAKTSLIRDKKRRAK